MEIRFTRVKTEEGLKALGEAWRTLDDGHAPGCVFRSWEWHTSWWQHFGQRCGRRELRVLVATDETDRVRGILPLFVETLPFLGLLARRRLAFLGEGVVGSDYLGLIAQADDEVALAALFADALASDVSQGQVELLELHDLADDDPLLGALSRSLREAGLNTQIVPRYRCPIAQLENADLATYLKNRPGGFGSQLRARKRALEKMPGFRLEVHATPSAIAGGLSTLFALHAARWADSGGSDAIPDSRVALFHRACAPALAARGWARLALLSVGDHAVAAGYGFLRGSRFAYYQAGLDPAWRARSAGTVVLGALLETACSQGAWEFDFLRGDEPYKAIWATTGRTTSSLHAVPRNLYSRATARLDLHARAIRHSVARRLPMPARRLFRRTFRLLAP